MAVLPPDIRFEPLMTCYLTDYTDADDVELGFKQGIFTGVKLYPANATTNSAAGVTDYGLIAPVLARMEAIGMRLLIHCEEVDPAVDVFDREAAYIDRKLRPMTKNFPGLKIIFEHLSSKIGVDYVRSTGGQVAATITPYHLQLNRTDWLGWGNRPYMLLHAGHQDGGGSAGATRSRHIRRCLFFPRDGFRAAFRGEEARDAVGAAGLFNAPVAIETYAQVFEEEGRLDALEAFASLNGPRHYGLPPNDGTITLEKTPWVAPEAIEVEGDEKRALIYRGGETIPWKVVAS